MIVEVETRTTIVRYIDIGEEIKTPEEAKKLIRYALKNIDADSFKNIVNAHITSPSKGRIFALAKKVTLTRVCVHVIVIRS